MKRKVEQTELFPVNGENQPSKYKLPKGWKLVSLGYTLESTQYGITTSSSQGHYRMFRMNNFASGKMSPDNVVSVDVSDEEAKRYILQKGDILFNRTNSYELVGKTGIFDLEGVYIFASYLVRLNVDKSKASPEFINYFLNSPAAQTKLKVIATKGVSQANINPTNLQKDITLLLPPLPEQRKIAAILNTWDTAIDTTEKLIVAKEQLKQGLMQRLLMGKKRLKGFTAEWKEAQMKDIFGRVTRRNDEGNTTVVTVSAQRGFVRQTDFFSKSVASETLDNYFLIEKGEFCYNKSYSKGYEWGATKRLKDFDKAVVTTLYICFGIKDQSKNSSDFFEQFFEANLLDRGLTKIAHEGGRAHGLLNVTPTDFFSLKMIVPCKEEQIAIAQLLQAADSELRLLKSKLENLKHQKKGLMQQLLTGRVRVKVEEDKSVVAV